MPSTFWLIACLATAIALALHVEWRRHRRILARIPIRIFVNGTRGKSSVTRLIASALREAGIRAVGKTTGTCARLILPDGTEVPVHRDGPPNIAELIRMCHRAARLDAEAIVFECMAVDPDLQRVAEERIMYPTITVVTNARLDHTDVQGSSPVDIAKAFAVRPGGTLVTADPIVAAAHRHRLDASDGRLVITRPDEVEIGELHAMTYVEHPENAALALAVAGELGIDRAVALRGIVGTTPDPGAASVMDLTTPAGSWSLVNLFAANDPASTFQALDTVEERFGSLGHPILLFAARSDRTARSAEFAAALAANRDRFRQVVVFGERTRAMIRRARSHGVDPPWILDAGNPSPAKLTVLLTERLAADPLAGAYVVGVGNIIGPAQKWLEHLADIVAREPQRSSLEEVPA